MPKRENHGPYLSMELLVFGLIFLIAITAQESPPKLDSIGVTVANSIPKIPAGIDGGGTNLPTATGREENMYITNPPPAQEPEPSPFYTFSISGTIITAQKNAGTVASGIDFGAVLNTVNKLLVTGDIIIIKSGTYPVYTTAYLSKSNITLQGESNTVIKSASTTSPSNYLISITGEADEVTGITFDGNLNTNISPVVHINGNGIILENCFLKNSSQYMIDAYEATNFIIRNNEISNCQNGISSTGQPGKPNSGLIEGNTISDFFDNGIKIRMADGIMIRNNYIDTYHPSTSQSTYPSATAIGIYLSGSVGLIVNTKVYINTITDTNIGFNRDMGILIDPGTAQVDINENKISNQRRGIWNKADIQLGENLFLNCARTQ